MSGSTAAALDGAPRIGPNAVLQLAETFRAHAEDGLAERVFTTAGHGDWLSAPPDSMIPQDAVARVHAALWDLAPRERARERAREAGLRTGDYLLAHRIPAPAQVILRWLPAPLAARALVKAISAHAWTFTGSGRFGAEFGPVLRLSIAANPLAARRSSEPDCVWHAAVFERLFRELVHPATRVREVACTALGAPACVFEVDWRSSR
jgi:divinyl protochlorophyllide a 8-vinyl-reductase